MIMSGMAQYFLVIVLVGAAAGKFAAHDQFLRTLVAIPWISLKSARTLSRLVPIIELGTALVLVALPRLGAMLASGILLVFTAVLAIELSAGRTFQCHCFGGRSVEATGPATIVRNLALIAAAIIVVWSADEVLLPAALVGVAAGLLFLTAELATDTLAARRAL